MANEALSVKIIGLEGTVSSHVWQLSLYSTQHLLSVQGSNSITPRSWGLQFVGNCF